jgi:hypothetical protein
MLDLPGISKKTLRMIEDEIEALLNTDEDNFEMYKYSLTPITEKMRFKNGIGEPEPAYKEPTELKSVLEAEQLVYEIPVRRGNDSIVATDDLYESAQDRIMIKVPGVSRSCYISRQRLSQLLDDDDSESYEENENGKNVTYRCLSVDKPTLLSYCEIG